jgi:hypothetical protein
LTATGAVVALAGRRIDAEGAPERFPLRHRNRVGQLIRDAMTDAGARVLVASAACGADLLALEAAGELGIRRRVVLPFDKATFRAQSVIDRPGDWGPLFDGVVADVERAGDLVLLGLSQSQQSAYEDTNRAILAEAAAISGISDIGRRVALIVWDGKPRGADDLTQQFLDEARARGWDAREISSIPTSD